MHIEAMVRSSATAHEASVRTGDASRVIPVPHKADGGGSAINGGEFLLLALATCYCNDLYREARRLGIGIEAVEVRAMADFPGIGLAATNVGYSARIVSPAPAAAIEQLLRETDAVAEVHNTVRAGVPVTLVPGDARPARP